MTGRIRSARFETKLLVIVVAALIGRVAYVWITKRDAAVWGDAFSYHYGANLLADGKGFIDPLRYEFSGGLRFPSAAHPPLYISYLATWSFVGLQSALWHRLASCLLGALTVALVGYLGRKLAGDRAGLIAAVLAAVYPQLWLNDAALLSETAAAFAVVLSMLTVERFREEPTWSRALQLGGALALAVLGRAELFILLPAIALPLVLGARGLTTRERVERLGLVAAAAVVLIGPWVAYNMTRFEHPVYLSNGLGATLLGGSCDAAWHGSNLGYWSTCPGSADEARIPPPSEATQARWQADPDGTIDERKAYFRRYFAGAPDESENDVTARREALDYISDHKGRFPAVVAARIGRIWNVYRPWQNASFDGVVEGRGLAQARLALVAYFFYAAAAIGGLISLRQRRHPIWPYLVLAGVVTFSVAITFGIQRYRIPVDAVLPALAAVFVDALWGRRREEACPVPVSSPSEPLSTT